MFPEHSGENIDDDSPVVVDRDTVLRDLRRIQRMAEADASHPSALRSIDLMAKIGGVTAPAGRGGSADEGGSVSPAAFHGLPETS